MGVFKTKDGIELYCENEFESTPEILRNKIINGCGPDGFWNYLIPNTMYGLSVIEACHIHDWMYFYGMTEEDRNRADRVFLNNIIRLIDARTGKGFIDRKILKPLRYKRAKTYYNAVNTFGGKAFWNNKKDQPKGK